MRGTIIIDGFEFTREDLSKIIREYINLKPKLIHSVPVMHVSTPTVLLNHELDKVINSLIFVNTELELNLMFSNKSDCTLSSPIINPINVPHPQEHFL